MIDDDKVALAVLARSLKRRGFRVRSFQDPESALNAISYDHPDAAIIDMHMPGMSGMDLVKQLSYRLNGRPFPLMILSAVEDEVALKEAYRHGVSDYLIKPVTEGELAVKLETAIKTHAQQHPDAIPRELAGFELLEETRRGEIASVYRVADRWGRFPDVVKSVKVLRPELGGVVEPLLRLRREIDVLARCHHPSIPPCTSRAPGAGSCSTSATRLPSRPSATRSASMGGSARRPRSSCSPTSPPPSTTCTPSRAGCSAT